MKLEKLSLVDDQFVTAEIAADAGIISLQAEVQPLGPVHIAHAVWKENGDDAMNYVSQRLTAVRDMIEEKLRANA